MIRLTDKAIENIKRLQEENDAVGYGLRFGLNRWRVFGVSIRAGI